GGDRILARRKDQADSPNHLPAGRTCRQGRRKLKEEMFKRWSKGQMGQPVMLLITIVVLSNLRVPAQEVENPITWSLKAETPAISHQPGAEFRILLIARIETGWHLYSPEQPPGGPIPTRITLPAEQPFKLKAEIETPLPRIELDPNFNLETQFFEEEAVF